MRQKRIKQLRKVLLKKTSDVLLLIRDVYGENTKNIENPQGVWKLFKKLYKEGKVPASLLILEKENK
jgi:hypothetical protein